MNEFQHRVAEKIRVLPVVEPPRHFVEIGREMLSTYPMPRSHDSALEQAECRFRRPRVNIAANIDTLSVLNRFVLGIQAPPPVSWVGF
jgi:hypothetical protein